MPDYDYGEERPALPQPAPEVLARFYAWLNEAQLTPLREALGLSQEEWRRLQKGLPSAREIGDRIGSLLPPGTSPSAEIVAMRR